MKAATLLGFKPVQFTLKSLYPIELVHSKISNLVDDYYKPFNRNKSKCFYGHILDNQFDIKMYIDHINSFTARIKIFLFNEDDGTRIDVRLEFENIVLIIILYFMLTGFLVFISGFIGWVSGSGTEIFMAYGAGFIGFIWIMSKMGYMISIDQSKSKLITLFRSLRVK